MRNWRAKSAKFIWHIDFRNTAKVWDALSGKELVTLDGHTIEIRSVAVSPAGQRIAGYKR